ncbi:hypothetical protein C8J35_102754 [Rhizobium sp. PP-F2F-G38]|nr:hypothetical protein C8J37_102754 [Rhizobium sp. PP-WC-1G-195]PYE99861.1 hypothetical protein C8J35_102754 [Rhizobium sp. PP-F2F-G38]
MKLKKGGHDGRLSHPARALHSFRAIKAWRQPQQMKSVSAA